MLQDYYTSSLYLVDWIYLDEKKPRDRDEDEIEEDDLENDWEEV